jgi:hypothetical protein
MAATPLDAPSDIQLTPISQLTSSDVQEEQMLLPSFIYLPLKEELDGGLPATCWGVFACERGAELPGRVIASAKSWLCPAGSDRR